MAAIAAGLRLGGTVAIAMTSDRLSALGVARLRTVAFSGIDVKDVDVQVQISAGLPAFTIVRHLARHA